MCSLSPVGETFPERRGVLKAHSEPSHQYPRCGDDGKNTPESISYGKEGNHTCLPSETFSRKHTYLLGLPGSRGPKCSAAGDGGGEGGKFVVSSTTKEYSRWERVLQISSIDSEQLNEHL